jgi:hypothetical protein
MPGCSALALQSAAQRHSCWTAGLHNKHTQHAAALSNSKSLNALAHVFAERCTAPLLLDSSPAQQNKQTQHAAALRSLVNNRSLKALARAFVPELAWLT